MGNRKVSGLTKRGGIWHVDKQIGKEQIRASTGTSDFKKAEEHLAKCITEHIEARLDGLRTDRSFRVAATKYLEDYSSLRSIATIPAHLKQLDPYLGSLTLKQVHMRSLQ